MHTQWCMHIHSASNVPPTTMWKSACCQQRPSNNNVEECLLPATSLQQCGRVFIASNVPPTMWKSVYFFLDNSCSVWGCKKTVIWNRLSILGTGKHTDKNNTVIERARYIRSFSLTHTHTLVVKCACVVPMTLLTPHQEAKLQQSHGNGNSGAPHCTVQTNGKKPMLHLRPLFFL